MIVKNDLFDYENRYILQDTDFFKFSLDSILLAEYIKKENHKGPIIDLCMGNAAVELILSKYMNNELIGFEIQKKVFDLAEKSIVDNNLAHQIKVINDDANNIASYFSKGSLNTIICNPPYFPYNGKMVNNVTEKAIARHEMFINLEQIFKIANDFLANNAILYIISRAERLDELIVLGSKYNVKIKNLELIFTKQNQKPTIVIAKCIKNSKNGLKIHCTNIYGLDSYKNIFMEE